MEHLVRILSERDRLALEWLRQQVGDAAVTAAVSRCAGPAKPYVSAVCRRLGLNAPAVTVSYRRPTAEGERSLASIRAILANAATRDTKSAHIRSVGM